MRAPTSSGPGAEVLPGPSSPGSVTTEIGGDRGALIVHVPAAWAGREIEIRRTTEPWTGAHVAVLPRRLARGDDHSAFFPSLRQGDYEIRPIAAHGPHAHQPLGTQVLPVRISGGEVADITW